MEKILSYPISAVAMLLFLLVLVIFHPIQWICLNVFGYHAHKKSVDYLNLFLLRIGHLLGTTYEVNNRHLIPEGVPVIFVANHQSLYDIIGIIWFFRKFHPKFVSKKELASGEFHPKFVSKKELASGVPSVSYNLRHGGSVVIDRKDPKQAIPVIKSLGEYIENNTRSAVIFPEGTRSKTGVPKEFAQSGFKILCKYAPSAWVVPISINNSWKFVKYGFFPFGLGNRLTFTVHKPVAVKDHPFEELMQMTEKAVVEGVKI